MTRNLSANTPNARLFAALVFTALALVSCLPASRDAARAVARAELKPCLNLPDLPTATCGTLTVPLDRQNLSAGSTTVSYALIPRGDQGKPSLGTIVPNPGGPGLSTIDFAGPQYAAALAPLLDRRELLLIDPRGVGRSSALRCPSLLDPARAFSAVQKQRELIGACGVKLGSVAQYYGTSAIADDFDEIRAGLRIDKLDLLGDSYGAFLMTVYAQRHPQHVRSVVLSGAYAVNFKPSGSEGIRALRRAISLVGERSGAYSGAVVLDDLAALVMRLRKRPETFKVTFKQKSYTATLDEWALASAIGSLYSGDPDLGKMVALASAIRASRTGDLAPIRTFVSEHMVKMATIFGTETVVNSDAANWATACHDYPRSFDYADNFQTRLRSYNADIAAQNNEDFNPFSAEAWITRDTYDSGACLAWPNDPTAKTPFPVGTPLTNLPVLVLSGDLDANTSSESGRQTAAQFPNARWIEVKGAGHTPSVTPQGQKLIIEFIALER